MPTSRSTCCTTSQSNAVEASSGRADASRCVQREGTIVFAIRGAIATTAVGLVVTAISVLPTAPAHAAEDPAPPALGATWLRGQLTDGLMFNSEFGSNDYGLSIDAALALDAVGDTATPGTIADALAAQVDQGNYVAGDAFGDAGSTYAGAVAKTVVLAQTVGADTTTYGGENFVTRLEGTVATTGAGAGRIADVSSFGDFTNILAQSFAVRALTDSGSTLAPSATTYLLGLQCADGSFRLDIPAAGQAPACDTNASPNVDATAVTILNLQDQTGNPTVVAALDAARNWLAQSQAPNGSFGSDGLITTPNTNSTGLAGWALGEAGNTTAAAKAATWLRGRQADDLGSCVTGLTGQEGAIAYDDAAFSAALTDGILATTQDQFRRATAQAVPALRWAPAATGPASAPTTPATGYVKAGTVQTVRVSGLAPGQAVCLARGTAQSVVANADAAGAASIRVRLPAGSNTRTYAALINGGNGGNLGSLSFKVLDAKTFPVEYKRKISRGNRQIVTVKGLAAAERVKLIYRGTTYTKVANADRRATFRFKVGNKVGDTRFRVVGHFGVRKVAKAFKVVR